MRTGAFGVADAATVQFSSPDKKLVVTVADDGGRPVYRVDYGETTFLAPSPLGLLTNIGDFSQGMALQESSFAVSPVSGHYELPTIKRSKVDVQATKAVCPFYKDGKHIFDVVFHVSDHDVAFKYKVYPQGNTPVLRGEGRDYGLRASSGHHDVPLPAIGTDGRLRANQSQL